ncbi:MAG: hypothetical protein Q8O56_13950 [Solirubrobacteraceae bacterium]|nr:hypothetical protein [Solirubrobacteraceae bacterium]
MPENKTPVPKVAAAGAAGAAATVIVFLASQFDVEMSAEVGGAFATLFAFAGGYLKRDTPR